MILARLASAVALTLVFCAGAAVHAEEPAIDRLSVPGPILFDADSYRLSWSSHPAPDYYKQEYLPAGQRSEHFSQMVLIDAIIPGADVEGALASQVAWLDRRKASDPTVNYAVVKNPQSGEAILDFVLSSDEPKQEYIVEWNAYRYAPLRGADGKSGVLLFGVSRRAYGDDATDFLRGLKSTRPKEIDALAKYKMPAVTLRAAD